MQRRLDIPIETTFAYSYSDGPATKTLSRIDEYLKESMALKSQILTLENERNMLLIQTKQIMTDKNELSNLLSRLRHYADISIEKEVESSQKPQKTQEYSKKPTNINFVGLDLPYSVQTEESVGEKEIVSLSFYLNTGSVIRSVRFSHDGNLIAFSNGKTLFVLSAVDHKLVCSVQIADSATLSGPIAFSSDDSKVATSSDDNLVVIVCLREQRILSRLSAHTALVSGIVFVREERTIMTTGYDGRLCCWNADDYSLLKTIQHGEYKSDSPHNYSGAISGLSISPDESFIIISFLRGFIGMYDTKLEYQMTKTVTKHMYTNCVHVCGQDNAILTANQDSTACRFSTKGIVKCTQTYKGHKDAVLSVVSSYDGLYTFTGSKDESIRVFNTSNGQLICTILAHKNSVLDLDINQSGTTLVSAGGDGAVCIWDVSVKQ